MDASTWQIITYVLGALGVIALILMVIVSLKIIRFIMLIALLVFAAGAYYSNEKKIEEEKVIFNTKNLGKGAAKILEGAKDIGGELSKSIDKTFSKEQKEKMSSTINSGLDKFQKWTDQISDKGVEILEEAKEKTENVEEETVDLLKK